MNFSLLLVIIAISLVQIFANNIKFAQRFYIASISDNDDFIFSPISLGIILELSQLGALGETRSQIRALLLDQNYKNTIASLNFNNNTKTLLDISSKFYLNRQFTIKDSFKIAASTDYRSEIESIDFADNFRAAKTINRWIKSKTRDRIRDIINPSSLDINTKFVIISAVYFKARFLRVFSKFATESESFYTFKGEIKAQMMQQIEIFNYVERADLKARFIEIKFQDNAALIIALPDKRDGLRVLENRILDVLEEQNFTKNLVEIKLPKFELETVLDLKKILQKMGVNAAFDASADFSGITGSREQLSISEMTQKSFIKIDESGVEAASISTGTFHKRSGLLLSPQISPKKFIADHPFIFYIKIKNIITFIGRVVEPKP